MTVDQSMDLELLRRFLAVAETRSVRKAARLQGISQPSLTRSVQQLEEMFGARLLERGTRGITLTAEGRMLAEQGPPLLAHAERLLRATRSVQDVRSLNVGFSALHGRMTQAVSDFQRRWPGCDLRLRQLPTAEQYRRLENGTLDVGLVFGGHAEPLEGFHAQVLEVIPVSLAVPDNWPLAAKDRVELRDLAGLPFIGSARESNPFRRELLEERCRSAGFSPNVVHECTQIGDSLKLVAIGMGVSFVASRTHAHRIAGVRYLPLSSELTDLELRLIMVWLDQHASPARQHFFESIERVFQEPQALPTTRAIARSTKNGKTHE